LAWASSMAWKWGSILGVILGRLLGVVFGRRALAGAITKTAPDIAGGRWSFRAEAYSAASLGA
jgi:hypothetical protein